jgi:hypothetical protein
LSGATDREVRVQLLRLAPGTLVPRHRHAGEVHAFNLAGWRELIDTGERVGPGGYVYEPPGNIDSWRAIGDSPVLLFTTTRGALDYLDDQGGVLSRTTTASSRLSWDAFLAGGEARGGTGESPRREPLPATPAR